MYSVTANFGAPLGDVQGFLASRGHIAERGGGVIIELGQRAGRHLGRRLARHVDPLEAIAARQLGIALQPCRDLPTRLRIDQALSFSASTGPQRRPWCRPGARTLR